METESKGEVTKQTSSRGALIAIVLFLLLLFGLIGYYVVSQDTSPETEPTQIESNDVDTSETLEVELVVSPTSEPIPTLGVTATATPTPTVPTNSPTPTKGLGLQANPTNTPTPTSFSLQTN